MALESRDLERAAEILDEFGWTQGYTGNEAVGFCATGAVNRALRERGGHFPWSMSMAIEEATGMGDWRAGVQLLPNGAAVELAGIIGFNDTPGRTKQEVQDVLMRGAKTLRDQGR